MYVFVINALLSVVAGKRRITENLFWRQMPRKIAARLLEVRQRVERFNCGQTAQVPIA